MPTNPVVKLKRGLLANLSNYPAIDGQLYLAEAAENVITDPSTVMAAGDSDYHIFVVDFTDGSNVKRRRLDAYRAFYAQLSASAATANKWTNARNFQIKDADESHSGTAVSVDGSSTSGYVLKLPATIKAALVGNVTGTADSAKALVTSAGVAYDVGSSSKPVYFDDGIPVVVGDSLDVSITGSSGEAGKWSSARNFQIQDNDGTNIGTATSVDGSVVTGYKLKLPATIKATLTGRATSATKLVNDSNQDLTVGSAKKPVYFSNGVPVVVGNESLEVTVESADSADRLSTNAGSTTTPVYFSGGVPVAVTGVSASLITGTLPMSVMPAGALERLAIVAQTATNNTDALVVQAEIDADRVQAGDVVQVMPLSGDDPGQMYFIYDDNGTLRYRQFASGTTARAAAADTADRLAASKNFSITGDVTANAVAFDGTGNVVLNTTYAGTLGVTKGGTGKTVWEQYRIVYADSTTTLSQLPLGTADQVLISGGSSAAPSWADQVDLIVGAANKWTSARSFITKLDSSSAASVDGSSTTQYQLGVSGVLGVGNGGTGKDSWTQWGLVYASATNALAQVAAGTAGQVLISGGSAAPAWANSDSLVAGSLKYALTLKVIDSSGATAKESTYGDSNMTQDLIYEIKASDILTTYVLNDTNSNAFTYTLVAGTWHSITVPTGMSTGSYIIQIKARAATNSVFNDEYFTGLMSYSAANCASGAEDSDEVLLHSSGKNSNGHRIYVRVRHVGGSKPIVELQCDADLTANVDVFDITFRRVI